MFQTWSLQLENEGIWTLYIGGFLFFHQRTLSSLYQVCCQNFSGDTDLSECYMYLNTLSLIYIFRFAFVTFRHLSYAKNCIRAVHGYEHKGRVLKCVLNEGITFLAKFLACRTCQSIQTRCVTWDNVCLDLQKCCFYLYNDHCYMYIHFLLKCLY